MENAFPSKSSEGESGDDEYDRKFQELQKYIPFLRGMMRKLEHSSDKLRAAQLKKMKNLYGLLTNPQKRLKFETLEKCEDVLNKLQEKLKGCFGPGKSSGKLDNVDSDQDISFGAPQTQGNFENQSAQGESNNVPFLCDSDSKSSSTSRDRMSAVTSVSLPKSHEEHFEMSTPTSSLHENNIAYRFKDNFKSDSTVTINQVRTSGEPVRPREEIPCLESPSSPTHVEPVAHTPPVCIPLERKEPLRDTRELSALQESRERLKKIMKQPTFAPTQSRRDSITQPSFTVCETRTPVAEGMTSTRDNFPGERPPVPPSPYTNSGGAFECPPLPPSLYPNRGGAYERPPVPPSPYPNRGGAYDRPPLPPSPYTNSSGAYERPPVPPSPYRNSAGAYERPPLPPSPYPNSAGAYERPPLPPSPYTNSAGAYERPPVPPSPYRNSAGAYERPPVPPSPYRNNAGAYERPPVPPSPYTNSAESRMGYSTPLRSPSCPPDRMGTPARSDIDPDFPFLQKNASYLPVNKDPEFPYLKKCESYLPHAPSTTPINNCDVTNRSSSMSLRAKLGQEIDTLHKVGVSTGGALRTLIHKDDKKGVEKKGDSNKETADDKLVVEDSDNRRDPKRNSIESQPNLGSPQSRVDSRRSSINSTEKDEDVRHRNSNFVLQPRNEVGSHSVDSHNQMPNQCSPTEEGRNLAQRPLISDRPIPMARQDLPLINPAPLLPDPKPNTVPHDPYSPVKPDFYSRPQTNQRSHVLCPATPLGQSRPSSRFQPQNRPLLPTPPSRFTSPWSNAGSGGTRQTSAHQLGFRYSHRSSTGQRTVEESRTDNLMPRQIPSFPQGRSFDSRNTLPEKDTPSPLFTPDTQVRLRTDLPEVSPNAFNRCEFNSDMKAKGGKDGAQDKFRDTYTKKREERDGKQDQNRSKDRERNEESSEKSHTKGKSDNFSSPLGRLYDSVAQPKTGKGYGAQTFRIPKKKPDPSKTESMPSAPSQKSPITENKTSVLETKPPDSLQSPPITGSRAERRLSPLRDPRKLRGKARPPSPVSDSSVSDTPPIWGVDTPTVRGTILSNVSSGLSAGNQSRPFRENRLDDSFTEDGSNQSRRSSRSPVDRTPRSRSRPLSPSDRKSRARSRSPDKSKSRGRSPWTSTRSERSKSRARSRPRSRSPEKIKSRAQSRSRSRTPERSQSRARSRPRSKTPERSKTRARSRPRSKTPERSKSRARSRPRSKTPERSKSRARSRPRSKTPERSKSRARSRPRSKTPERSKSRARSRPRSKTPERSKSRARLRSGSRSPVRSKSRGRLRDASHSPERRKSSRSPVERKSRGRSRMRSKSRGRSVSIVSETRSSVAGKLSSPDTASPSAQTESRERSVSERSTSQESHQTTDSGSYSSLSRRRDRSDDRDRLRDRRSYRARSRRKSRSRSRGRSRIRASSRDTRYSCSGRSGRGSKSSSPGRRSSSRIRRSSRERRRSRSRSLSREVECATDVKPQQTEISSESKSSPTRATRIEPDVSSTSDAQSVDDKWTREADSKEVTCAQSAEKAKVDSSIKSAPETAKSSEKVEDKLAALKDLLGNPELMKFLVEKNILNLSAVGTLTAVQPDSNQSLKTEASESTISTSCVPNDTPVAPAETPKNTATDNSESTIVAEAPVTTDVATAETLKKADEPDNAQKSASTEQRCSNSCAEETPFSESVRVPNTRRSRKKQPAKKVRRDGRNSSAAGESSVERQPQAAIEEKQPQPPQPRRRGKNELEKLQDDIREMFDCAEIVTATGQRTCRVRREAQEQGAKSRNSSSEKSRADSDVDFRSRSRSRGDNSSKTLNTSSDSNRSVDTSETGPTVGDQEHHGFGSDDDDTPLNILQKSLDLRSSPAPDCSPIRTFTKKRKYNLIDSETESEVDDGRVSSCSVVIENIAPSTFSKDIAPQRAPSRNMARRGKKSGFSNFGSRKIPQEEPKPAASEESVEDVDKSLIDCNNIIDWPDGEIHGKLTRRQLKMRLTEQDVESPKSSIPKTEDSSHQSVCPLGSKVVSPLVETEAVAASDSKATPPANNNSDTITESLDQAVHEKDVLSETGVQSPPPDTDKNSVDDSTRTGGLQDVQTAAFIKSEPVADNKESLHALKGDGSLSRELKHPVESFIKNFVYSNSSVSCRHCSWKGKSIVPHYKCVHPEAEIDHSRFSLEMASKLLADSEKEGYTTMSEREVSAKFPDPIGRYLLQCVLCKTKLNAHRFAKHFSLHTGEYHFRCMLCTYTAVSKEYVQEHYSNVHIVGTRAPLEHVPHGQMTTRNVLLVYTCSRCNFFQLRKESIQNHIKSVHPNAQDCSIKRVAVSEIVDTQSNRARKPKTFVEATTKVAATVVAVGAEAAAKTQENTSEAAKENEPQAEVSKTEDSGENLRQNPLYIPPPAQSGIVETTSASQPDQEIPHPEAPIAETTSASQPDLEIPHPEAPIAETTSASQPDQEIPHPEAPIAETTSASQPDQEIPHPEAPIAETTSASQPDQEIPHPEAAIADSSLQPPETLTAGNPPALSTANEVDRDKAIDLSVFISSDPLKSQEQQIEEERLKKLKDAGETLRNRPIKPRTSILDRIVERISAPQDGPPEAELPQQNALPGISPLPTLRATPARRANKSLLSMGPQNTVPTDAEKKIFRQYSAKSQDTVTEDLELSNVPSLSAGELNSTVELMRKKIESPIITRNKTASSVHQFWNSSVIDDSITIATILKMRDPNVTSVRVGDVEVRRGSDEGEMYICHGDKCLFTSTLPRLYIEHLATEHHRWRVRQVCSECKHELEEQGDMIYAFNHIRTHHLVQEFPLGRPQPARRLPSAVPLLRARRIPGDKLSTPCSSLALKKTLTEPGLTFQPMASLDLEATSQPAASPGPEATPTVSSGLEPGLEPTSELAPPQEDETAFFCRIENVVSLSSIDPLGGDLDVDPVEEERPNTPPFCGQLSVPPAVPLSPQSLSVQAVFIEKTPDSGRTSVEEISPAALAKLNPIQMNTPRTIGKVKFQKETAVAAEMHTKEKLRHFFKCTGRRCSYSTNIQTNFVYHYSMHVSKESECAGASCKFEWNKCIYCGTEESSGSRLTEHMIQFHGDCCFQCAYCLYRAAYQANVVFHQNISHASEPVVVLECRRVSEFPQIPKPPQKIEFYRCVQAPAECSEEFFFPEDFKYHLRAQHSDDKYKCGICMSEFGSTEHLVLHCNVQHSIRAYHCLYCRKAAETQKEMSHHLCYDHPEEAMVIAARTRSLTQKSTMEISGLNQKIETFRLDDEKLNSPDYLVKLPPTTGGSLVVPSEETDNPEQEVVFDNERTKEKKSTTNKEIIVLCDDDPLKDPGSCNQLISARQYKSKGSAVFGSPETLHPQVQKSDPPNSEPKKNEERVLSADELVAKVTKEIENTGLVGKDLYRCVHKDCSYTADSMSQLKDHMYVCDFARNSPELICVHCRRVFKTVDTFLEHLRSHGLHRYSCGSCSKRAATLNLITNHMKKAHYFMEYTVVPLHPLQKDPDKSLFTVYAKDVAIGKRRTKKIAKPVYYPVKALANYEAPVTDKVVFSPEEIPLLPHSAVFTKDYRCSICNYANKVRLNLVRHLQQHAAGREASPTPVVNPVPHLERNNGEKMFDTMTNHAVSSNQPRRDSTGSATPGVNPERNNGEKMVDAVTNDASSSNQPRRDSTISAKEFEELPKFVPEQARYACHVCSSVTSNITLYLMHLTALHPELKEVGYQCPHCQDRAFPAVPLDRITHHLKMHDNTLYKCPYCNFHHYQRHHVQRHTQDKHSDQNQYYQVVREPESKTSSQPTCEGSSEQSGQESAESEGLAKEHQVVSFECGICGWEGLREEVLNHVRTVHKMYNSLKCTACEYGTNIRKNFALHFRRKHDGVPQQIIAILRKVVRSGSNTTKPIQEKRTKELPTPSWQLQKGHAKHVRGIMFEENGPKPRELEHGDFGEPVTGKRPYSNEHKDGPEPKKLQAGVLSKWTGNSREEPLDKYRCPKCCCVLEMTEFQFRIHLLEESESSSWLCHLCSKASENFSCLLKHYAHDHMITDDVFVMRNSLYDTKVTDNVNRLITKHQKIRQKEYQSGSSFQEAGKSRVTRTSRSLASSPVAWTSGSASENSSDCFGVPVPKRAKVLPSNSSQNQIKFLPAPSLASPPRYSPSPASSLSPPTLKKIMIVKPMSLPGTSKAEVFNKRLLEDPEDLEINIEEVEEDSRSNEDPQDFEINIEEVEEDSRSNEEWERFEKPSEQQCWVCRESFTSREEMKIHIQEVHDRESKEFALNPLPSESSSAPADSRRYPCGHCKITFKNKFSRRHHEMRHWLHKPYKCGHCDAQFIHENEVKKHSARAHRDKDPLVITNEVPPSEQTFVPLRKKRKTEKEKSEQPSCPNTPDSKASESTSVNVSEEDYSHVFYPNVYRCSHCTRRSTSLEQLEIHVESNHRAKYVKDFIFKFDRLVFSDLVNNRRPYRFRCGMCFQIGSLVSLSEHYKVYHPNNPVALRGCTEKVFQCSLCVCYYSAVGFMTRHFEERHPEQPVKFEKRVIDPDLDKRQYKCLWCNEVMDSLQALAKHHDRFHCHLKASYKEMDVTQKSKAGKPESGTALAEDPVVEQGPSPSLGSPKSVKVKPRAVARKSTSKVRSVARKSTSTPARACVSNVNYMDGPSSDEEAFDDVVDKSREGTSFYGRPTSPVDVKRVTCPIQCGPVVRRVNVATASQAMDLHPVVVCVDVSDDSSPNSQPCDNSFPL